MVVMLVLVSKHHDETALLVSAETEVCGIRARHADGCARPVRGSSRRSRPVSTTVFGRIV